MTDKFSKEKLKSLEKWMALEEDMVDIIPPFNFDQDNRKILLELISDDSILVLEKAISVTLYLESIKSNPPKFSKIQSDLKSLAESLSKHTKWLTEPSGNYDRYMLHEVKTRYPGSAEELQMVVKSLPILIDAMNRASRSPPFINELLANVQNEAIQTNLGGRPENKVKKYLAWRVVMIFAKTGQEPTIYRDGPVGRLLEICFKCAGYNDADPFNSLKDKPKWEEMKKLSKMYKTTP